MFNPRKNAILVIPSWSLVKSTSYNLLKATRIADRMMIKEPEQGAEAPQPPNMNWCGAIPQDDECFVCRNYLMSICNKCVENGTQQEKNFCKAVRGVCGHIIHNHCMQRRLYYCPICAIKWQFFQYVSIN